MKGLGLCQAARKDKDFLLGYYLPYVFWEQPTLLQAQHCPGQAPQDRSSPKPRKTCSLRHSPAAAGDALEAEPFSCTVLLAGVLGWSLGC